MNNTQLLDWDSDILGISAAKILTSPLTTENLALLLQGLKSQGVKLVYWLIPSTDLVSQKAAQNCAGFLADKKVAGKAIQLIELTPDDSKKSYFKIQLTIDKVGKYVNEAKVFDKNVNIYTYSIVKFTPNAIVTDDYFS